MSCVSSGHTAADPTLTASFLSVWFILKTGSPGNELEILEGVNRVGIKLLVDRK